MNFDFPYVLEVIPAIMKYVPLTLFMSILAMAVAILIGILLAVMKESKKAVLRGFTSIYLSFFRSVPTLVLLFIIYYGLPQLFPSLTAMEAVTAAIIGLGIKQAQAHTGFAHTIDHHSFQLWLDTCGTQFFQ